jgi:hypothetical protein
MANRNDYDPIEGGEDAGDVDRNVEDLLRGEQGESYPCYNGIP